MASQYFGNDPWAAVSGAGRPNLGGFMRAWQGPSMRDQLEMMQYREAIRQRQALEDYNQRKLAIEEQQVPGQMARDQAAAEAAKAAALANTAQGKHYDVQTEQAKAMMERESLAQQAEMLAQVLRSGPQKNTTNRLGIVSGLPQQAAALATQQGLLPQEQYNTGQYSQEQLVPYLEAIRNAAATATVVGNPAAASRLAIPDTSWDTGSGFAIQRGTGDLMVIPSARPGVQQELTPNAALSARTADMGMGFQSLPVDLQRTIDSAITNAPSATSMQPYTIPGMARRQATPVPQQAQATQPKAKKQYVEMKTYQGKTYGLLPGADPTKKESWEVVQ